jgi:hypothetical protein
MHSLNAIIYANEAAARRAQAFSLKDRTARTVEHYKNTGRLASEPYRGPVFGSDTVAKED